MQNVNLPNSWSSMPGWGAPTSSWMNAFKGWGQDSTAANQQLGQVFTSGSNANLAEQKGALANAFGYLKGTNKANIMDINAGAKKTQGAVAQQLIGSGLGNSTIMGSMMTGVNLARQNALSHSRAAFGNLLYGAASQNALANSGLAQQQLNTQFAGTHIGFPDMGAFAQMAGMAGAGMGGMGGGGQSFQYDPSRPVGGPMPAWAHYGGGSGGGGDIGGGGGGWGGYGSQPGREIMPTPYGGGWGDLYAGGGMGIGLGAQVPEAAFYQGAGGDF